MLDIGLTSLSHWLQLSGIRRRGRQVLHLGLEDDEAVQEVEGARRRLYNLAVAPARAQPPPHRRLGWSDQVLGLNNTSTHDTAVLISPTNKTYIT